MRFAASLRRLLLLGLLAVTLQAIYAFGRGHPQDLPWTALDLRQPIGLFTGRKLARLRETSGACRMLLDDAGIGHVALPARSDGPTCGYADGVRLAGGTYRPAGLGTSCAVAAALTMWEREVVQPAALRLLGAPVVRIDHYGSYACRRVSGRGSGGGTGRWSEHAAAAAVDIAGFRLADGRRITVAAHWAGGAGDRARAEAAFLHAVRDGACGLFSTILSPDYNRAHRDHLHLDQALRGTSGWRLCR